MSASRPPKVTIEVAWETDPLTRPADVDFTDLAVEGVGVKSLKATRGGRVRTGELVAGSASALLDFPGRVLEPRYEGSPWYPNVDLRRRVRFILERYPLIYPVEDGGGAVEIEPIGDGGGADSDYLIVDGGDADLGGEVVTKVIWTGFISRLPNTWRRTLALSNLSAVGLFALVANIQLPPSVLDVTMRELAPVGYWPLTETAGEFADDVAGDHDGFYMQPVTTTGGVVPFDSRPCMQSESRTSSNPSGQSTYAYGLPGSSEVSFGMWLRWQDGRGPATGMPVAGLRQFSGSPTGFVQLGVAGDYDYTAEAFTGLAILFLDIGTPAGEIRIVAGDPLSPPGQFGEPTVTLVDSAPHLLVVTVRSNVYIDNSDASVYLDGVELTDVDVDTSGIGSLDSLLLASGMESMDSAAFGWGTWFSETTDAPERANVGHAFYFDRILTASEVEDIWVAGTDPWNGDTTGERAIKVLDLAGVDPADRDIPTGTKVCGPADLGSQRLGPYLELIAATERAPIFESADGKITLGAPLPNLPDVAFVLSDDPDGDSGTPYEQIEPDYSTTRMVNIADFTRVGGNSLQITDPDSVLRYGPVPLRLDTLYASPTDLRDAATAIVSRNKEPRLSIDGATVDSRHPGEVPAGVSLESEVAEVAHMFARPPGGGDPVDWYFQIESITQTLDGQGNWKTSFGLYEHVVLPCFQLDTEGAGLDESVLCEG